MPWVVGIDEAGYGPNLGPFVMTSVACRVPDEHAAADLWRLLRAAVRRQAEPDDGRLLVEDSKVVYAGPKGMRRLESGVLAAAGHPEKVPTLADLLGRLAPACCAAVREECWYDGSTPLPTDAPAEEVAGVGERLAGACRENGAAFATVRSVVVCPARFNAVTERWNSKAVVLSVALAELLRDGPTLGGDAEPVSVVIDKHGGRNAYAAMLQQAVPAGMVIAEEESALRSSYKIVGLPGPLRLAFEPRADANYFCVALASMVSKYVRELLMLEFNRFWSKHVPDLKPTAGYPGDAARYFEAIRPVVQKLGVPESTIWRCR